MLSLSYTDHAGWILSDPDYPAELDYPADQADQAVDTDPDYPADPAMGWAEYHRLRLPMGRP